MLDKGAVVRPDVFHIRLPVSFAGMMIENNLRLYESLRRHQKKKAGHPKALSNGKSSNPLD